MCDWMPSPSSWHPYFKLIPFLQLLASRLRSIRRLQIVMLVLLWLVNLHVTGSCEVNSFKWSKDSLVNGSLDDSFRCRWCEYLKWGRRGGGKVYKGEQSWSLKSQTHTSGTEDNHMHAAAEEQWCAHVHTQRQRDGQICMHIIIIYTFVPHGKNTLLGLSASVYVYSTVLTFLLTKDRK